MKYGNRTRVEGAIHPRPERRGFLRKLGKTTFHVAGFVRGTGIHFGIAGTGAEFEGYLKGDHGKGTWRNTGDGGSWVLEKD